MLPHLLCALLFVSPSPATGRDILRAMHDRYAGKWYRTLTFVQQNTATTPDGRTEHSVWRESAALPGRLTSDTRFNQYRPVAGAWVSAEVAFLVDGQPRWLEQYTDIHTDTPLPDALFDPRQWMNAR